MEDTRYYIQGIIGKLFHSGRFWKWMYYGIVQGLFVYIIGYYTNDQFLEDTGYIQDLWSCGMYPF